MDTSADVLQLIEEAYKTFSKGQRYIADYICNNYDKAVDMTAARLGKIVGVSESTVVRFAIELGFNQYGSDSEGWHSRFDYKKKDRRVLFDSLEEWTVSISTKDDRSNEQ